MTLSRGGAMLGADYCQNWVIFACRFTVGAIPSLRQRSVTEISPRNPSSTTRIYSSALNRLRAARLISLITFVAPVPDLFFKYQTPGTLPKGHEL